MQGQVICCPIHEQVLSERIKVGGSTYVIVGIQTHNSLCTTKPHQLCVIFSLNKVVVF